MNEKHEKQSESSKSDQYFVMDALKEICINNIEFFKEDESTFGLRLHGAYLGIIDHLEAAKPLITKIESFMAEYDFDEHTPGNGYRSFLLVFESAVQHTMKISKYVTENRSSLLFQVSRKSIYMKEIEACNHLLASLTTCLTHLLTLHSWSISGDLFPKGEHTPEELLKRTDSINQYAFYGRTLGIHYCDSMKPILKFLSICMAGYSESYYAGSGGRLVRTTNQMFNSTKYLIDPELRARRIVNISQNAGVDFCKSFWFLAESQIMHTLPSIVGSKIKINKLLTLAPEPLKMLNSADEFVDIPVPYSHLGTGSIQVRLMSSHRRQGMVGQRLNENLKDTLPKSKYLIIHAHGGGFVAQSSKSHEIYLREWCVALNVPILSIDYSLAPNAPYPRALEEVFFAYCWAVQNAELLGTTAEKIVMCGDSAGANLNLGCLMKCIENGIRKPDGIMIAYCPLLVNFDPSPSRLLCLMDPLLPFGFMMRCLKAYCNPSDEILETNQKRLMELEEIKRAKVNHNEQIKKNFNLNGASLNPVLLTVEDKSEHDLISNIIDDNDEKSDSFEEISVWERVRTESDINNLQAHLSPASDDTNDTLAGTSFLTHTENENATSQSDNNSNNNNNNTIEIVSPMDSVATSLEDDSLPITIQNMPYSSSNNLQQCNMMNDDVENKEMENEKKDTFLDVNLPDKRDELKEKEEYVSDYIEKYVFESTIAEDGQERPSLRKASRTISEENFVFDIGRDALSVQNIQEKFQRVTSNIVNAVSSTFSQITSSNAPIIRRNYSCDDAADIKSSLDALVAKSPIEEFQFEVPKDPYLSPYYASDEILKQFPAVKIMSLVLDPCLDDCIMFGKKLKNLGVDVHVDVMPGLPHGFLNFSTLSKDAHEGSKLCIQRLAELLNINLDTEDAKVKIFC